jgi:hypothetical protein
MERYRKMNRNLNTDALVSLLRFMLILVAIVVIIFIITRLVLWYHS